MGVAFYCSERSHTGGSGWARGPSRELLVRTSRAGTPQRRALHCMCISGEQGERKRHQVRARTRSCNHPSLCSSSGVESWWGMQAIGARTLVYAWFTRRRHSFSVADIASTQRCVAEVVPQKRRMHARASMPSSWLRTTSKLPLPLGLASSCVISPHSEPRRAMAPDSRRPTCSRVPMHKVFKRTTGDSERLFTCNFRRSSASNNEGRRNSLGAAKGRVVSNAHRIPRCELVLEGIEAVETFEASKRRRGARCGP
ncbi:hypothetical protein L227DRAFT_219799 [Lentinus tigrinus ALCF2SS1-6]|uniref:Uncharacterized protein n=1 Tax=Lentinus tigrinus ALCF2SS1-6 TaxID=1328759 RepID=A0A5C2SRG4_9APHY|nr:hypothetical protein L227DRAFT_219799 [Lentinus tigrinus ALCF2SS1-6]